MTDTVAAAAAHEMLENAVAKLFDDQTASSSACTVAKLDRYVELLLKWNRVYNLTAITEPEQIITHHLLDSLAIVDLLDRYMRSERSPALLDVGSGAGLPGIPLAIVRACWEITMLDSNSKKTAFVQQVAAELRLANARTVTTRVESWTSDKFDLITARAFSSLTDLVAKTRHVLKPSGFWAAMKGNIPEDEIKALPADIELASIERLAVSGLDAERHLLLLKEKAQ